MQPFCVRGVVRDGQVVLEVPLDLPDGTAVTVTDYDPADFAPIGPVDPESRAIVTKLLLDLQKKRAILNGSAEQAKTGVGRE
jgi:hypothetical protein